MSALTSLERFGEMGPFFKKRSWRHCLQSELALDENKNELGNELSRIQMKQVSILG